MKKEIFSIIFFIFLLNSVSAIPINRYYDSSNYYIRLNNNLLLNPAFTGFNNHFNLGVCYGRYTPDIPVSNGFSKPAEFIIAPEISFGKLVSFSIGLSEKFKSEAAFYSKELALAISVSLQTIKFGNLRIGVSVGSLDYGNDFSKALFGDQINPKLGFIYQTNESVPASGEYSIKMERYNAGIFYSYKNYFYAGFSKLDINEPMFSFYQDNGFTLHAKSVITAGGRVPVSRDFDISISTLIENTGYYELTKTTPALGVGYKCKYYLGGGITYINSDITSYFFQMYGNFWDCMTLSLKYELLQENYFSNSLSPSYWGISSTFYIDRFLKYNK